MVGWSSRPGLSVAVVTCLVLGSLGLVAGLSAQAGAGPVGTHAGAPASPAPSHPAKALSSGSAAATGLARALSLENGLRAKGISPDTIHLPNLAGAVTDPAQPVTPAYTKAPAPMGVADIGLENRSGVLVPYELNTTSVAGTVNITNLQSLYVDGDGPDTYGIQLNSVANGVTIFGNSSYEFWSQNYGIYTISTKQLFFGDEVWNFSSYSMVFPANSVYGFSPNGTWSCFPYLYCGIGPTITIGYPFTLTLYLNTSTIADRPALYFNYTVSNDTFRQSSSFDYLIFNSSVGTPTRSAPTPYYQADGYNYDPAGEVNDMEIDIIGNDDGDLTAFTAADATISLQYWNATAEKMQEVPSAFNSGSETGETSVGLLVYSSGGSSPIGIVREGPSLLGGLWNYSGQSGAVPFTLHLRPANAFLFVNIGDVENASEAQWVPTSSSGITTFNLPTGGTYYLDFLMSDRDPANLVETATTPTTLVVALAVDATQGVYTPLFALDNAELAAISSSGAGTAADPYVLIHNQNGPLAPQFAQWDDWLFPVFPGLLLANTSAWVDATPPSFEINIPSWELAAPYVPSFNLPFTTGLPLTNDLQIQFYDASNISLVRAAGISGWLSVFLYGFPESSVMLWNCTNMLVTSNTFLDQGDALLLYNSNSTATSNNTVWGNTFLSAPVAGANPADLDDSGMWVTGVNETESGDLIYNNVFEVPVPAITPTVDPFPCDQYGICIPLNYTDTWNVSEQPATNYMVVNGWNLTGSIIRTWYQGGNYWSNYGTTMNPYGVLPYNDSGWITVGGDYVPLVPFSLYPVTFLETGLPSGSVWNVTENGVFSWSDSSTIGFWSPNGTFAFNVSGPSGYVVTAAPALFTVAGAAVTVNVAFAPLELVAVHETGLMAAIEWSASVNGTGTGNMTLTVFNDTSAIDFELTPGFYNVTAAAAGYNVSPSIVPLTVGHGGVSLYFVFGLFPGRLNLTVLPVGATVWVDSQQVTLTNGNWSSVEPPGLHSIVVVASGYYTYYNNVTVTSNETTKVPISLTAVSSSSSSSGTMGISATGWAIIAGLAVLAVIFLVGTIYFARRSRPGGGPPKTPPAQPWQEPPPENPPPPSS